MTAKTAFVTGSTGFVGLCLLEELLAQGWRAIALHRPTSDLKYLQQLGAERAEGDICDIESLRAVMPLRPDAVFHVAGSLNLWSRRNKQQDRINIEGTRNVVEVALERHARRLVHTSSISAYGIHQGRINEESKQLGGRSWINYQRSKFQAEEEVRKGIAKGLDAVIINPSSIIGAYDTNGWARFIRMVIQDSLPGVPPGALSFCHSRQVASAMVASVERGRCGENYLLGGADHTFMELVHEIGRITSYPVPKRSTSAWMMILAARLGQMRSYLTGKPPALTPEAVGMITRRMYCDPSKAMRELGFKPVSLTVMLEESYEWLKKEGLLPKPQRKHADRPPRKAAQA